MAIVQKLIIKESNTSNYQIQVYDDTGLYNPSNPDGYGGLNGTPAELIEKYVFDLINLNTNQSYRQVQSDDLDNEEEYHNPSIIRILNRELITIDPNNFELQKFLDGVYKLNMSVVTKSVFAGSGFTGSDALVNTQSAQSLYDYYDGIIVDNSEIYYFKDVQDSTILLDRVIVEDFTSFKPILKTSKTFILNNNLVDCINKKIANMASNCECDNSDNLNAVTELQILQWGLDRAVIKEDYIQALEYMTLLLNICKHYNCGCG